MQPGMLRNQLSSHLLNAHISQDGSPYHQLMIRRKDGVLQDLFRQNDVWEFELRVKVSHHVVPSLPPQDIVGDCLTMLSAQHPSNHCSCIVKFTSFEQKRRSRCRCQLIHWNASRHLECCSSKSFDNSKSKRL